MSENENQSTVSVFPRHLLNIKEASKIAGVSPNTIYRRVANGTFPEPVMVPSPNVRGPRMVSHWRKHDVLQWRLGEEDDLIDSMEGTFDIEKYRITPEQAHAALLEKERQNRREGFDIVRDTRIVSNRRIDPTVPDPEPYEEKVDVAPKQSFDWRKHTMLITAAVVGLMCGLIFG